MGVVLDIISSFIVRAAIIIIILRMMINLHDALWKNSERANVEQSLATVVELISRDLKNAGNDGNSAHKDFIVTQMSVMDFWEDTSYHSIGASPVAHMIRYSLQSDSSLVRDVDGINPIKVAYNVTTFSLTYFDKNGNNLSYGTTSGIKSVGVLVTIKSTSTLNKGFYYGTTDTVPIQASWDQKIFLPNM